ncbi:MAG TPA: N-acetyl-gamma-glutamyl-phosphate reductase [Candidatus Binatia bacterium]|nr:N-acetyl-gamma-glutamyl-phosphate reductase [Candidatus Binatia bacterium]
MTRVHVWGASGYAGAEAIRLLHAHPLLELGVLESHSHAGERVSEHFPRLRATPYRFGESGSTLAAATDADVAIVAGSEDHAEAIVPALLERRVRVVDLSSRYRLDESAVYGLSEWFGEAVAEAQLVANPGCYPTAALLALLPLAQVASPRHVVIDAKSGITGAGRTPHVDSLFAEVSGDVRAYGLKGHRHYPEIQRFLHAGGIEASLTFTPHVVPIARGMLVNAYAVCDVAVSADKVAAAYDRAYARAPFVRMLWGNRAPSVAAVVGTNDAEIRVDVEGPVVRILCAIDNLGKGAAGQAIQNVNLMLGLPQESGLDARAIVA